MLDEILGIVKDVTSEAINKNTSIPNDKKDLAVETSTDSIASALTSNLGEIGSLFSGNGDSSSLMKTIQDSVVGSLMKKVGLDSDIAKNLVSSMLPMVVGALTDKLGDNNGGGLDLESVAKALSNGKGGGGFGDVLGAFGKILG